jgi:hypothetical protein
VGSNPATAPIPYLGMNKYRVDVLDMPQGEAQEKCPPCAHCGNKAWLIDGYNGEFWLLCIAHDDPIITEPLPDHIEVFD